MLHDGNDHVRNVCNHGIVRRFGHSQNVACVQVGGWGWGGDGGGAKSELVATFILKGNICIIRLCTRLFAKVDSWRYTQFTYWQLLKPADVSRPGRSVIRSHQNKGTRGNSPHVTPHLVLPFGPIHKFPVRVHSSSLGQTQ